MIDLWTLSLGDSAFLWLLWPFCVSGRLANLIPFWCSGFNYLKRSDVVRLDMWVCFCGGGRLTSSPLSLNIISFTPSFFPEKFGSTEACCQRTVSLWPLQSVTQFLCSYTGNGFRLGGLMVVCYPEKGFYHARVIPKIIKWSPLSLWSALTKSVALLFPTASTWDGPNVGNQFQPMHMTISDTVRFNLENQSKVLIRSEQGNKEFLGAWIPNPKNHLLQSCKEKHSPDQYYDQYFYYFILFIYLWGESLWKPL